LESGTWSDAVVGGCEQFEVVEVDNGDNFSHLERFSKKKICIILYDVQLVNYTKVIRGPRVLVLYRMIFYRNVSAISNITTRWCWIYEYFTRM